MAYEQAPVGSVGAAISSVIAVSVKITVATFVVIFMAAKEKVVRDTRVRGWMGMFGRIPSTPPARASGP